MHRKKFSRGKQKLGMPAGQGGGGETPWFKTVSVPSSSLSLVLGQLESVQTSEEEQESRREEGEEERGLGEKWLHPHCLFRWRTQGMGHGP